MVDGLLALAPYGSQPVRYQHFIRDGINGPCVGIVLVALDFAIFYIRFATLWGHARPENEERILFRRFWRFRRSRASRRGTSPRAWRFFCRPCTGSGPRRAGTVGTPRSCRRCSIGAGMSGGRSTGSIPWAPNGNGGSRFSKDAFSAQCSPHRQSPPFRAKACSSSLTYGTPAWAHRAFRRSFETSFMDRIHSASWPSAGRG